MDVFEEADISGARPERSTEDGRGDGELEVAAGFVPVVGNEHPAGGFIDGEDGTVFVEDRDGGAVGEDDCVSVAAGTRHGERLERKLRTDTHKQ